MIEAYLQSVPNAAKHLIDLVTTGSSTTRVVMRALRDR